MAWSRTKSAFVSTAILGFTWSSTICGTYFLPVIDQGLVSKKLYLLDRLHLPSTQDGKIPSSNVPFECLTKTLKIFTLTKSILNRLFYNFLYELRRFQIQHLKRFQDLAFWAAYIQACHY